MCGPCPWGGRARHPSVPARRPRLSLGATRLLLVAALCSYSPNYSFLGVLLLVGYPHPLCAPTRSLPAPARCSCPSASVLARCPCSYSFVCSLRFSLPIPDLARVRPPPAQLTRARDERNLNETSSTSLAVQLAMQARAAAWRRVLRRRALRQRTNETLTHPTHTSTHDLTEKENGVAIARGRLAWWRRWLGVAPRARTARKGMIPATAASKPA